MRNLVLGCTTMIIVLATSALAGINGGARSLLAKQETLLLTGPLERLPADKKYVAVLGQKIPVQYLAGVEPTSTISVFGIAQADGSLLVSSVQVGETYVPGATQIVLTGLLEKLDTTTGRGVVNGVPVDLVTLFTGDINVATVGSVVRVSGIQPSVGGVVLAATVTVGLSVETDVFSPLGINGGARTNNTGSLDATSLGINGGARANYQYREVHSSQAEFAGRDRLFRRSRLRD